MLKIIGPYGIIGSHVNISFTESFIGIVLAQIFVATPFSAIALRSAFLSVNKDLIDVYKTLGFSKFRLLTKIILPSTRQIWLGGIILTWLRAFGEFGATVLVSYHPYSLPILLYVRFSSTGMNNIDSAISYSILIGVIAIVIYFALSQTYLRSKKSIGSKKLISSIKTAEKNFKNGPVLKIAVGNPTGPAAATNLILSKFLSELSSFEFEHFLNQSKYLTLVGPTGAGKTTLLKNILNLNRINQKKILEREKKFAKIGYVAQSSPVILNKTVLFEIKQCTGKFTDENLYLIKRLGLDNLLTSKTNVLSGGEKQRLGIYRALANRPELILFDEPFANLDVLTKVNLIKDLEEILNGVDAVGILVTHDINEGLRLSPLVAIVEDLKIVQLDYFDNLSKAPKDLLTAHICGYETFIESKVTDGHLTLAQDVSVEFSSFDSNVMWSVHPAKINVSRVSIGDESDLRLVGVLVSTFKTSSMDCYGYFDIGQDGVIKSRLDLDVIFDYVPGETFYLNFNPSDLVVIKAHS